MTPSAVPTDSLTAALDGLVDRVPGAEPAVARSPDGPLLGRSRNVQDPLAEQLSGRYLEPARTATGGDSGAHHWRR